VRQIRDTFGLDAALLVRDESGTFTGRAHPACALCLSEKEESVAAWTFQKRQAAGRFTDTLPDSEALHLPLVAGDTAAGVLSVRLETPLSFMHRELLETFAIQIALSLEKDRLAQANRQAQINAQSEQLQRTLFDSVSHELKTPLAAIQAALEQGPQSPIQTEIGKAVARLTKVVNHLLDMTRLDSGLMKPNLEWCDPGELVREALEENPAPEHLLKLDIPQGLPPIRVDARLLSQVLSLLIANAANYSPPGTEIAVSVSNAAEKLRISIADRGPGLKSGEENRIFEKFYRSPGTPAGGIGLGLSIAKRLVEAHGGQITAGNRPGGGSIFVVELPASERLNLPKEEEPA
jgi:two-component system sensor histidine kinase KdpD